MYKKAHHNTIYAFYIIIVALLSLYNKEREHTGSGTITFTTMLHSDLALVTATSDNTPSIQTSVTTKLMDSAALC